MYLFKRVIQKQEKRRKLKCHIRGKKDQDRLFQYTRTPYRFDLELGAFKGKNTLPCCCLILYRHMYVYTDVKLYVSIRDSLFLFLSSRQDELGSTQNLSVQRYLRSLHVRFVGALSF